MILHPLPAPEETPAGPPPGLPATDRVLPPLPPGVRAPVRRPGPLGRAMDRMDPAVRHGFRRVLTLLCILPLLLILAREAPRLPQSPLILGYGFVVLTGTIAMLYIAYSKYDDPAVRELRRRPRDLDTFPPLPAVPRVSFLLAVKDEEDCIEDCVRSMAASDYPDLQIVVVDDLSEDGTRDVLRRLEHELDITVLYLDKNLGKKHALVRACEIADGDVIAFTDSDCILAPDALRRCIDALVRHPELGAVSGHCRALNAPVSVFTRAQDVWYEGQFRVAKAAEAVFARSLASPGRSPSSAATRSTTTCPPGPATASSVPRSASPPTGSSPATCSARSGRARASSGSTPTRRSSPPRTSRSARGGSATSSPPGCGPTSRPGSGRS